MELRQQPPQQGYVLKKMSVLVIYHKTTNGIVTAFGLVDFLPSKAMY